MSAIEVLSKITHKELSEGKLRTAEIKVGDETKVLPVEQDTNVVRGTIEKFTTGTTKFGDYVEFGGRFEAIRLTDGRKFTSSKMILPSNAESLLWDAFVAAQADDKDATLLFTLVLGVKPNVTAAVGYKHTVRLSTDGMGSADPLAAHRSKFASDLAAILGPEAAAAIEAGKVDQLQLGDGTKADAETGEVIEQQPEAETPAKGKKEKTEA